MLEAQGDRGDLRHRVIAINEELEVYFAVLHYLVDEVGPCFVSGPRKTKCDRFYADGRIKVLSQKYGIK